VWSTTLQWQDGMAFRVALDGYSFTIDAAPEHGGTRRGPRPKGLVLSALAGCAAMDVISILTKMHQVPRTFAVHCEADGVTEEHPKVFTAPLRVVLELEGDLDPNKVWRAVALSRDKYCGTAAMLRKHAPIEYAVRINGELVPEPAPT
jgi:putative redox protein